MGNARTALLAWLAARLAGGRFVLRVEDLDRARVLPDAESELRRDLAWLGLDWDEGPDVGGPYAPYRQSERGALYRQIVDDLIHRDLAFPCACSRAEIARAASAPHPEDEEGPAYPGTCRALSPAAVAARAAEQGRMPAIRFRASAFGDETFAFVDRVRGGVDPFANAGLDDFVLWRGDGTASYQLAVVVDDAAMAVSEIVRGDDLLRSTPRQLALYRAMGLKAPTFAHVPLLLTPTGDRLAKRTRPASVASTRDAGVAANVVVGRLAASAGLCAEGEAVSADDLRRELGAVDVLWARLGRTPAVWW